jgi:hypothetical protein
MKWFYTHVPKITVQVVPLLNSASTHHGERAHWLLPVSSTGPLTVRAAASHATAPRRYSCTVRLLLHHVMFMQRTNTSLRSNRSVAGRRAEASAHPQLATVGRFLFVPTPGSRCHNRVVTSSQPLKTTYSVLKLIRAFSPAISVWGTSVTTFSVCGSCFYTSVPKLVAPIDVLNWERGLHEDIV